MKNWRFFEENVNSINIYRVSQTSTALNVLLCVMYKMYYTANLEVYVGRQPEEPFSKDTSALSVDERLV